MDTNANQLVTTRLRAKIQPASLNVIVRPDGSTHALPGQGGVVTGISLGDVASRWHGDHVEPGASLGHDDPSANQAIRLFSCVGNSATVIDGPSSGAKGIVYGKHGAVLAMFAPEALARLAPGDSVAIEACGVGLTVSNMLDIRFHSCSPSLLQAMASSAGDHLEIEVSAILPSIAAAAGIGMPASMFNMDLHSWSPPILEQARDLRFGDLVAVQDQDHRFGRQHRPGWTMVGIVSHGTATAGGHGLGLMTLLTGPTSCFSFTVGQRGRLDRLLPMPWGIAQ